MSDPPNSASEQAGGEDLQDLYDNAPCGYLSLSPNGKIVKVNLTFATWTGHAVSDLIGKRFLDLLSIAGRIFHETHFAPLLRMQGFFEEVALDVVTATGSRVPMLANAREHRDTSGNVIVTRVAMFRAKDRRQYERSLVEARSTSDEANKALSQSLLDERSVGELREQFIAVLGHDLRNPLASIDGGARLLLKESLTERGATVVALMQASVVRMSTLIDNVLDFARGRLGGGLSLTKSVTDLEPVLQQVVSELRLGMPDRVIDTDFFLPVPTHVDAQRIAQLVSNLLANALVHGAPEAPVRIEAASKGDGVIAISVTNSGAAIPPETMARLFQPFFRGEARQSKHGLGLGLHIASEIAKAHGGTLSVESNDAFTRFSFTVQNELQT